ncbi:MAG: MFS transporter [Alphaproteobacteria bacterium]|nr:MFS transporter [Alphaproteobacteria bacterium]
MTMSMPDDRRSRQRLVVLALITIATLVNYLDRTVMSVAAPLIRGEFHIDPSIQGVVFSAFSFSYAFAQIPGGAFLDRYGIRLTYALALFFWSGMTLMLGFANGVIWLIACLLMLGIFEAPCYPANSRILSNWFPQNERARATGVYSIGQYAGLALFSTLLFWITANFGWRALFLIVGAAGVIFAFVFYLGYRDPDKSRRVSQRELDHIAAGGGLGANIAPTRFSWANVKKLLRHRQIVGASLGQFCSNSTQVFFLTWFPTYLATERHMAWIKVGAAAVLPYAAAAIGVFSGGLFSDFLLRRSGSANLARKLPIVIGLLLASTIVSANYIADNSLVIIIMSVAFFGQGICNLGWTVVADIAPKNLAGLTGGVFNFCANLAGIMTPIVIGYLVKSTGSFFGGLAYIAVLALLGILCYVLVMGDIHRLKVETD